MTTAAMVAAFTGTAFFAGYVFGWLVWRKAFRTALKGWQNARDGWAHCLRVLGTMTGLRIYDAIADNLERPPLTDDALRIRDAEMAQRLIDESRKVA